MRPQFTGRIVEWDREKGHGWIESEGQRIFLHWREFAERRKRPEVGDRIKFSAGTGPTGRICAQEAIHLNDGGRFGFADTLFLGLLLVLPAAAIARLPSAWGIMASYALLVNVIAYFLYQQDKKRARIRRWRVSETMLHFLELLGGWPGAFVAQRRLRHKCSKLRYQVVFWAVVLLHQFLAFDFLREWTVSQTLWAKLTI